MEPQTRESVQLGGLGVVFTLSAELTGGGFEIVEHPLQPGALAAPPHTHRHEDEYSYVLEGEIGVMIADHTLTAPAGSYIVKPRGVPHTFWNESGIPARVLEIIAPAGFSGYFREVAAILARSGEPDFARIARVAARYGLELHPEQIPQIEAEHNVTLA